MGLPVPSARILIDGSNDPSELAERGSINAAKKSAREVTTEYSEFLEEMKKSTIEGLNGGVTWDTSREAADVAGYIGTSRVGPIVRNYARTDAVRKAVDDYEMRKGTEGPSAAWGNLEKEWTLTNPVGTGLVPYDLEAPAKHLTPRPTPIRNSTPRIKGQGGARRFKVISGFTGTGTGGATTVQPGINESSTNAGPGGLSYIRGPQCGVAA